MIRDIALFVHIIVGLALIVLPIVILTNLKQNKPWLRWLGVLTAFLAWALLWPAGELYLIFYPATKTLINSGAWPWAHQILMETKEHWGIILPMVATVAAGLVWTNKAEESKRWWKLVIVMAVLIGVMGRLISMGGNA